VSIESGLRSPGAGCKVLYVGPFDQTGWGRASIDYALALDSIGVDVACRPFSYGGDVRAAPPRVHELMKKPAHGAGFIIQHCLPRDFVYHGGAANFGLYATETTDFRASGWADRINMLDGAIVINPQSAQASRDSGVTVPLYVVPHACDVSRFQRSFAAVENARRIKGMVKAV
jgi:hypothetical protein